MCYHTIAWNSANKQIYGKVCEITRKKPWGFKEDKPDIVNVTVNEFIDNPIFFDTIILHILVGEGEDINLVKKLLKITYKHCVKLLILEHNPTSKDWVNNNNVTKERLNILIEEITKFKDDIIIDNLDRNILYSMSTIYPLMLPDLNDKFYNENINKKFVTINDLGIDKKNLIYTHTSECPLLDKYIPQIPENKNITWIVGGQLYLEIIPKLKSNTHHLIDSVLLQIIYARYVIENDITEEFRNKISSLYDINELKRMKNESPDYQEQDGNPKHWRNVINVKKIYANIKEQIKSIRFVNLKEFKSEDEIVYISTVPKEYWIHLIKDNYIISAIEPPRDHPKFYNKDLKHG